MTYEKYLSIIANEAYQLAHLPIDRDLRFTQFARNVKRLIPQANIAVGENFTAVNVQHPVFGITRFVGVTGLFDIVEQCADILHKFLPEVKKEGDDADGSV